MTPPRTCLSNYKNSTMPNNPLAGNSSIMAAYLPSGWPSTIRTIQQQETVSTTTPSTSPSFGKLSYASGSFGTSIYTWSAPCQSTSSDSTPNHTNAQQDPTLHETVANIDPVTILNKPIRKLRQWITNAQNHMQAHYKAAQLHAKLRTHDIRQYFPKKNTQLQSATTAKNLLWQP